jgi:hypothetical protein
MKLIPIWFLNERLIYAGIIPLHPFRQGKGVLAEWEGRLF